MKTTSSVIDAPRFLPIVFPVCSYTISRIFNTIPREISLHRAASTIRARLKKCPPGQDLDQYPLFEKLLYHPTPVRVLSRPCEERSTIPCLCRVRATSRFRRIFATPLFPSSSCPSESCPPNVLSRLNLLFLYLPYSTNYRKNSLFMNGIDYVFSKSPALEKLSL